MKKLVIQDLRTREGKSPKKGVCGVLRTTHTPFFGIFFNELRKSYYSECLRKSVGDSPMIFLKTREK